jgi:hypothetical protein
MARQDESLLTPAVARVDAAAVGSVGPPGFSATPQVPTAADVPPAPSTRSRVRPLWILGAAIIAGAAAALVVLSLGSGRANNSAAQAIAQAINLRPSDLPGFVVSAPDHSSAGNQFNARMKACVGSGFISQFSRGNLADVNSPTFTSGSGLQAEQVSSGVTIVRSSAVVRGDLAAIDSGRIQGCLASSLDGMTVPTNSGATVTVNNVQVAALPTAQGANGSFGLRTTMSMSALGINIPVVLDILGYGVGRDELALMAFAIGRPFPQQTEQRLSSLLVSRAVAHPH